MKVALITHHWIPNFGANIQALATFSYLRKRHDVQVLHYVPRFLEDRYRRIVSNKQRHEHIRFCERFLGLSPVLRNEEQIERYCYEQQFETIVSGSDAVFRLSRNSVTCEGAFPNPFWLQWSRRRPDYRPRIGFISGSATGATYYSFPRWLKRGIRERLEAADFLSVRDAWTKLMFTLISGGAIDAPVSPDPSSILDTVFDLPSEFTQAPLSQTQPYILYSARNGRVTDDWLQCFVNICHKQGFKVYGLPLPEYEMTFPFDKTIELPLSPAAWYAWIKHASGFVGERFHPLACSLFNKVPFVTIDHYRKEGFRKQFTFINIPITSKVYDLCERSGYVSHCIHYRALKRISPTKVLDLLIRWDDTAAGDYIAKARVLFPRTLEALLNAPVRATPTGQPLIHTKEQHERTSKSQGIGCYPDVQPSDVCH